MREIKFRAWFKDTSEMKNVAISKLYSGNTSWMHLSPQPMSDYRLVDVMQYTGLKDKNGREIYESDILLWDEKEFGRPFKEIVKWDYEQFSMRLRDWGQFCEVIGNIYENADLLGRDND